MKNIKYVVIAILFASLLSCTSEDTIEEDLSTLNQDIYKTGDDSAGGTASRDGD